MPTENVINKNRYMKKVGTKDIENLIEAKVNKLKGRTKSHKIEWTEKTWNPSAGWKKRTY